jgi:hypothetical protein
LSCVEKHRDQKSPESSTPTSLARHPGEMGWQHRKQRRLGQKRANSAKLPKQARRLNTHVGLSKTARFSSKLRNCLMKTWSVGASDRVELLELRPSGWKCSNETPWPMQNEYLPSIEISKLEAVMLDLQTPITPSLKHCAIIPPWRIVKPIAIFKSDPCPVDRLCRLHSAV